MTRKKNNKKYLLIIGVGLVLGLVFIALKTIDQIKNSWSGKGQISIGIEAENKDSYVLTLTPGKEMAVVIRIPAKTMIDTPWFGEYQVEKLSLLSKQEENQLIYNRSLSYFLGLAVDESFINTSLKLDGLEESTVKKSLSRLFVPPKNITFWRVWRYLSDKDLVWQIIDLENYGEVDYLAGNTEVFRVDPSVISRQFTEYLTDPMVKKEEISLSVFNLGGSQGLASLISEIPINMGIRVVEVDSLNLDIEFEDCLILLSKPELSETYSVRRLSRVLGCQVKEGSGNGIGDIELLIKDVKID